MLSGSESWFSGQLLVVFGLLDGEIATSGYAVTCGLVGASK